WHHRKTWRMVARRASESWLEPLCALGRQTIQQVKSELAENGRDWPQARRLVDCARLLYLLNKDDEARQVVGDLAHELERGPYWPHQLEQADAHLSDVVPVLENLDGLLR